ncbi:MAG: RIP metalloprotease RseP [Celeribacter sp.]|jgi:regulator of sigma E protease
MDILSDIPSFGGVIGTILAFVVALSIIVAIHEYGHYIIGRLSGIHAEVFSLGFGPVLLSRHDKHGTKWQLAALPFGGFVKFLGDADAASGKDGEAIHEMTPAEMRRTMHGAPLWARAATVAAGPIFNFILSIIVFAAVIGVRGIAVEPVTVSQAVDLPADLPVLEQGDIILGVGGQDTPDYSAFYTALDALPVEDTVQYSVDRDGQEQTVEAVYPFPPLISALQPDSAAMDAGLRVGDVITAIDGAPITAFRELQAVVGEGDGAPLLLDVWRDGSQMDFTLAPRRVDMPASEGGFETRWLIGITGGLAFTPATRVPNPAEAVWMGVKQTGFIIESSLSGLYHMVTGAISSCNLRGPLGIAETSGQAASQGASSFIWFIAVLSTAVGLLNLFPIPVLDGGHLVFHAYEAVAGRPPSDRVLRVLMSVGLVLILSLMVFGLTNDLFCP